MNRFIIHRNIRRYQKLLEFEADEARRRTILDLLAEEKGKLGELPETPGAAGSQRAQQFD